MFVQVHLVKGWREPLWYHVSGKLASQVCLGALVDVPLRNVKHTALVIRILLDLPPGVTHTIREIEGVVIAPSDKAYRLFVEQLAALYCTTPARLYRRFISLVTAAPKKELKAKATALVEEVSDQSQNVTLTDEQKAAYDAIAPYIENPSYHAFLLKGVTGSGKTEVYKALINGVWAQGKSIIFLVPEVSLALRFEMILKEQLPKEIVLHSLHSLSRVSERRTLWDAIHNKKQMILVGVHLPLFIPLANIGLIIVDEEHEGSFREKRHPKIHSRDAALLRARHHDIPIVLGSATPSLATMAGIEKGSIIPCSLTKRFKGTFPQIVKAHLGNRSQVRKNFWITKELEKALTECFSRGEQAILYLNRRGHSFCAQCTSCGHIPMCDNCSVSLTPHEHHGRNSTGYMLVCHYCAKEQALPEVCVGCSSPMKKSHMKGIGTQKLFNIVQKIFPDIRIARADLDSTKDKRQWAQTAEDFYKRRYDLLIGTQLVTKGYDFPGVTCVGIVWADLGLFVPHYDVRETVLQKLIQVSGRAGRAQEKSTVVVQHMADDSLFDMISEEHYSAFCQDELAIRKELLYPPYARFIQVEVSHADSNVVERDAKRFANKLSSHIADTNAHCVVLGPVVPPVSRIQNIDYRHIYVRSQSFGQAYRLFGAVLKEISLAAHVNIVPTP